MDLTLSALPEEIDVGETTKILAIVKDPDGVLMSGVPVTFRTGGYLSPTLVTVTTDSSGVAEYTFRGASAGADTVYASATATLDTGLPASATAEQDVTVVAAASSISVYAPSTTLTMGTADTETSATLTARATVKDANSDFVEGASVAFNVVADACTGFEFSPAYASGTTDGAGLATYAITVTATNKGTSCSYTVTAVASKIQGQAVGTVTVNP